MAPGNGKGFERRVQRRGDRARFGQLGVAASVQPVHIREDAETARRDWGDRAEANGYTWRSLVDAGAVVAFGTDAPVEPIDPAQPAHRDVLVVTLRAR